MSIGSTWNKWDLHIHTPASFGWQGEKFSAMDSEKKTESLKKIIGEIEESTADVFGIMNYWTFDGYFKIQEYIGGLPTRPKTLILPGIEFRMEAPTDFRLNSHLLFDNTLSESDLGIFLSGLRIVHEPELPVSKENFIRSRRVLMAGN